MSSLSSIMVPCMTTALQKGMNGHGVLLLMISKGTKNGDFVEMVRDSLSLSLFKSSYSIYCALSVIFCAGMLRRTWCVYVLTHPLMF